MESFNRLDSVFWIKKSKYDQSILNGVKNTLTHVSDSKKIGIRKETRIEYFYETDEYLKVPRQYCKKFGNFSDFRNTKNFWTGKRKWDPNKPLYDIPERNQKKFYLDSIQSIIDDDVGIVGKATPGFGKTVCGIAIAARLGLKTIIIVEKEELLEQWEAAALDFLGIKCGIVQGKKCIYKNRDIVIGMHKSLSINDYGKDFYDYFSFKITDECHHLGAKTHWEVDSQFPVLFNLGLSGTPEVFDGNKNHLLKMAIGRIKANGRLIMDKISVTKVKWHKMVSPNQYKYNIRSEDYNLQKLIDRIVSDSERNRKIAYDASKTAAAGHEVILLSARIEHLEKLKLLTEYFLEQNESLRKSGKRIECGWFTGQVPDHRRKNKKRLMTKAEKKYSAMFCALRFATYPKAQEGLDIPKLSALFLTTPKKDIEQAVGRIGRPYPGKLPPIVVDYCDCLVKELESYEEARDAFYKKNKFPVTEVNLIPNEEQSWLKVKGY